MVTNRMIERASVQLTEGETTPKPKPHECVVFRDQFTAGLRMPCQDFIEEIWKSYNIEMHHLTPNGIAKISLFIWAVKSQDVNLDIRTFCALHEMHTQFRTRCRKGKMLSSTLVVAVSSLHVVLSKFHQLLRTSELKIGTDIGFIILFC